MYKYVLIENNIVISVQSSTNAIDSENLICVDELPEIGSRYENGVFFAPVVEIEQIRIITLGAFRSRLTLEEKVAISSSSDPVVVVLSDDLKSSSFIDLDCEQLKQGLDYLVSKSLLVDSRVAELLKNGVDIERL